ncbi:MAG: hypothetical protein GX913_05990 [Clostridiales bacterium]|nr:hypothetical protein [Clostridiales bacterium]
MNLVKVKQSFYKLCEQNKVNDELMLNEDGRPCVLIIQLKFKGKLRDFVVPLRSNISPKTPKKQFMGLPPNPKTKQKHFHGIHYIKIFPIDKAYIDKYNVDGDSYYATILAILNREEPNIISDCQNYLLEIENGKKHFMTPNIDGILNVIDTLHAQSSK